VKTSWPDPLSAEGVSAFKLRGHLARLTYERSGVVKKGGQLVLFGGGACAILGYNTSVPHGKKFDLEGFAVETPEQHAKGSGRLPRLTGGYEVTYFHPGPLPLVVLRGPTTDDLAQKFFGYRDYPSLLADAVQSNGFTTVPLLRMVESKAKRGAAIDLVGLVQADRAVRGTEDPIINERRWQKAVGGAASTLLKRQVSCPDWLTRAAHLCQEAYK